MKKILLLFVFAIAATNLHAQEKADFYSILYHEIPGHFFNRIGLMHQHDGSIILNNYIFQRTESWQSILLGKALYKTSPISLTITDSLFIADTSSSCAYFIDFITPNPQGEGNIRASFEYHENCDSTFIRICHFPDDDLNINHEEDILTPLCDGYAYGGLNSVVDCWGDLIMRYYKDRSDLCLDCYDSYMARISPDGTLKYQDTLFTGDFYPINPSLRTLKESPLQYYQWGSPDHDPDNNDLAICVIDSLFNTNVVVINYVFSEEVINSNQIAYKYFCLNGDTQVIPIGEDEILVAAEYVSDTNFHGAAEYGVAVVKYDLRTMQQKGYVLFDDHTGGHNGQAQCMDIKKMSDGTVYFIYKENGYPAESVQIVKMDTDLNMDWKRFCKTDNIDIFPMGGHSILYKDEQGEEQGIAWMGGGKTTGSNYGDNLVLFLLNHDGPVGLENYGIEVRPYAFYPNPAKERLHFEYSPDVQPAKVELYDLQGRLVGTQRSNFEDINVGQLPAGTYTLRVTMEDGKAYSDKAVKE